MWNNIYENNNPWKKRISKSGTHECTYLYEWEMDEIWKKKLLQNRDSMCIAPLKKTLCYRRRRPPRTNGNHFKFLGFYYIKGNFSISKILKGNFVFAQECGVQEEKCGGAGRNCLQKILHFILDITKKFYFVHLLRINEMT